MGYLTRKYSIFNGKYIILYSHDSLNGILYKGSESLNFIKFINKNSCKGWWSCIVMSNSLYLKIIDSIGVGFTEIFSCVEGELIFIF